MLSSSTDAIRRHDEWREEFSAAMRAATERADKMDKRLERMEREGRRRLGDHENRSRELDEHRKEFRDFLARFDAFLAGRGGNGRSREKP